MGMVLTFEYRHLFDEERPDVETLLKDIPSKFVIGILAIINDTLATKGTHAGTQLTLLKQLSVNFDSGIREQVLRRAIPLLSNGWELFVFPSTVEFINREVINFREGPEPGTDYGTDELNIFKALVAIGDEIIQRDLETNKESIEAAKLGGNNLIKLMWPHLIRQFEFTSKPDPIFETHKGLAFMSFISNHPKFSELASAYFNSLGCDSGYTYIHKLLGIAVPHLKREVTDDPMDNFYRIKVDEPEPVLESLVINPREIQGNPDKQFDYLGLKEKPLFKFDRNEYIVPHWDYLYNALFTGLIFSLYNNSRIKLLYEEADGFANFKTTVSREFSEDILFKSIMTKCFSRKYDTLKFFNDNDSFNPDCYYRHGNNVFIIEFKDYLLSSEVIQSGSYDAIKSAIDQKFVSYSVEVKGKTKVRNKGVYQLARNIELLNTNQDLFWSIDEKARSSKLKLRNMVIHPVIVQTSFYFDFPGINEYLNDKIQDRLNPIRNTFRKVAPFVMINFHYFLERLLLFADSKIDLHEELEYYQNTITKCKVKARRSMDVNDWLQTMLPFGFINSVEYRKHYFYRRKEVLSELYQCWKIPTGS